MRKGIPEGRTLKTSRNAIVSVVCQTISLILGFVSRTAFIRAVGVEYLGVNAVFTNVISLLSLAELGLGTAFAFTLYRPLRNDDWPKVSAVLALYRRTYRWVALGVAAVGIASVPLLPIIIKTNTPENKLSLLYLVFLANSVISYLFADRVAVINADQRIYITRLYTFAFDVGRVLVQILVLVEFRSYLGYLVVQLVATVLTNVALARKAVKLYPAAFNASGFFTSDERTALWRNVRAMAVYKLSGVMLNGTTNIVISVVLGTVVVGYYSNHLLVVGALVTVLDALFVSSAASVGNMVSGSEKSTLRNVFEDTGTISFLIHATLGVLLLTTLDEAIKLWLGLEFGLGLPAVVAMVVSFYVYGMMRPVMLFREASGIFTRAQYAVLVTAVLNLVLSLILGHIFGLFGVLVSNPVARLLVQGWFEPMILLQSHIDMRLSQYLWWQARLGILVVVAGIAALLCAGLVEGEGVFPLISRAAIALGICIVVFGTAMGTSRSVRRIYSRLGRLWVRDRFKVRESNSRDL